MSSFSLPEIPSSLLGAIYQAAADPNLWPEALHQLTRWAGGMLGTMQARRLGSGPCVVMTGARAGYREAYLEGLHRVDPHHAHLATLPVGRALLSREVLSDEELVRSEYYAGFCRPQRIRAFQGVILVRNSEWTVSLGMFAPDDHEFDHATRLKLDALAPHVSRALTLGFHFEMSAADNFALRMMALMRVAGFVRVDAALNVLEHGAAEPLHSGTCALELVGGALRTRNPRHHERLLGAVAAAVTGESCSFTLPAGTGTLAIGVGPGPRFSPFEVARSATILFERAPAEPDNDQVLPELPPSLRRVAELLALGHSDKEIADLLEMPLTTARTYVARVLKRLESTSRRELMSRYGAAR
jgi:hypothetical protein